MQELSMPANKRGLGKGLDGLIRNNVNTTAAAAKSAEDMARIETVIETLFRYYMHEPELILREFPDLADPDPEELIKDQIAGMTDRYAETKYKEISNTI